MKNFNILKAAILCMVIFYWFSTGCDNDKNSTGPTRDMDLVGTWDMTEITWEFPGDTTMLTQSQLAQMGFFAIYEINEDGTFIQTSNMVDMSEAGPAEIYTGTWRTSGNQFVMTVTMNDQTNTGAFEYCIEDNILTFINASPSGDSRIIMEYIRQ